MAATMIPLTAFSPDGEYLAYCGPDGRLKIWETATGTLRQEYTPSSHLTAMCTCLSWTPERPQLTNKRRKKKQKYSSTETQVEGPNVIGMGTLPGKILLYSVGKGDLSSEMSDGHSDSVNCLSWDLENDEMFSCSHDSHIVQWSVGKGRVKSKWKADQGSIHCIALLPDGQTILSSGRSIKWWDIEKQQILKKFTGHASQVFLLKLVTFPNEKVEDGYFVSAASGDRLLSAWHFQNSARSALASFSLPDEPISFDVSRLSSRNEKLLLAAVTKVGTLHIFEHQLNGTSRKPIEPKVTLQIASNSEKKPKPIPVLVSQMCNDVNQNIAIAYGNFLKVTCEKMPYSSLENQMYLVRQTALEMTNQELEKHKTKVKAPEVPSDSRVLAPGYMVPCQPTQESDQGTQKRKLDNSHDSHQLPMEERLGSLKLELPSSSGAQPDTENLSHLLIQGLHSKDEKILNKVFNRVEGEIIVKTIQRLPIEAVVPLLKELHHRLHGKWAMSHSLLHWLRVVLSIHTSYLTTCSGLDKILSPLYQLMDARVCLFQKMAHLKGRMDLIMSQVESRKTSEFNSQTLALVVYQDESSDDADSYIDDLLLSHSESEPDWNEFSEDEAERDDEDCIEMEQEQMPEVEGGSDDEKENNALSD